MGLSDFAHLVKPSLALVRVVTLALLYLGCVVCILIYIIGLVGGSGFFEIF